MVRHLTSVCYSALVSESQTQISLCHNLLLGCQIILRFVQSTIISRFGTLVLHINAEKPLRLDFQNLYCLFFSWFYVWKFRVNVSFNIVSRRIYSGTLRVETSRWKPPDADAASICRESTQILQDRETCSQSMQAPLTLKVKPLLISTYTFDTNIRWNKIAIYSLDSMWRGRGLTACFVTLRYSIQRHTPRWWVAFLDGECLNYDVPETAL